MYLVLVHLSCICSKPFFILPLLKYVVCKTNNNSACLYTSVYFWKGALIYIYVIPQPIKKCVSMCLKHENTSFLWKNICANACHGPLSPCAQKRINQFNGYTLTNRLFIFMFAHRDKNICRLKTTSWIIQILTQRLLCDYLNVTNKK